jgi:hypothetical protein
MWPKPKVIVEESTAYVYDLPGTYIQSGEPSINMGGRVVHGKPKSGETRRLVYPLLAVEWMTIPKGKFAVSVTGRKYFISHHAWLAYKGKPILRARVKQGWTSYWWKPWKYVEEVHFGG